MPKREKNMWANQMVEVVEAVRLLTRSTGASMSELTQELGVTKRTVYRLKATLERLLAAPLDEVDGLLQSEKRWKFPAGFTIKLPITDELGISTPELMALYALRMQAGLFHGSIISEDIDSAFSKIGKALSPAARNMLESYASLFISVPKTPKDYSSHAEVIEELSMAILDRTTCTISYTTFSDEEITEKCYDVNPLHFFERDGGLYIFAVISHYGDIRLLAVERIKRVEATDKHYEWPKHFDPEVLLKSAFGLYWDDPFTAKIRFAKSQARYIREREWSKNQIIEELADGSIIMTMDTSGKYDVKKWVMSLGTDAELLEPKDLRDEILLEVEKMTMTYRQGS
jgi:predicted DNA-binding transcriptional regulator YafY